MDDPTRGTQGDADEDAEADTGEMTLPSSADEAKQREREMEESGEENAA